MSQQLLNQSMQESMSAIMDGEADELELLRVLKASGDPGVRQQWQRYQVARAALHKEEQLPKLDISTAVMAAIAADEPAGKRRKPLFGMARVAVAASVTVAVLGGVSLYHQSGNGAAGGLAAQGQPPAVAAPAMQGPMRIQAPAILAGYKGSGAVEHPGPRSRRDQADWRYNYAPRQLLNGNDSSAHGAVDGRAR